MWPKAGLSVPLTHRMMTSQHKPQVRIDRKEAVRMDVLVKAFLRANRMTARVNTERIYSTWDAVSGAAPYTLRRYFRGGTLYITLSSAVIRSQLFSRRDYLKDQINLRLADDPLFSREDQLVGLVQQIILK